MSASIRTALRFDLVALEPFSITAPERAVSIDRPMAATPFGEVYVPASSLAGSLRAHLATTGLATTLLGSESPLRLTAEVRSNEPLEPSLIGLLGTKVMGPDGQPLRDTALELRGQTAIDATRGSARSRTLRWSSLAPAGTAIALWAVAEGSLEDDHLRALATWQPVVGSQRTTGHGRCQVRSLRWGRIDLDSPDGLRTWLRHPDGGPRLIDDVAVNSVDVEEPTAHLVLDLTLAVVDGLFTAGPASPDEPNRGLPLKDRQGRLVIDGASLKGVLRSRASYILASLGVDGVEECAASAQACGACPVCTLFGSTERRGLMRVRSAVITGADGTAAPLVQQRPHVGIDRVSGGARPGLLFSESVVIAGWLPLTVEALQNVTLPAWAEPLLAAIALDMHDGFLGIGGRTTRGFGTVRIVRDQGRPFDRDAFTGRVGSLRTTLEELQR